MTRESPDVITQRLEALGMVTEFSAMLEWTLRSAFCALVGSKYAAVVAGGQSADWLIGQCEALAKANLEMQADRRQALLDALQLCRQANRRRNTLIHGAKTASREDDGSLSTIRWPRHGYLPDVQPWTAATIREAATELGAAGGRLGEALQNAVSPELGVIDQALAMESLRREEDEAERRPPGQPRRPGNRRPRRASLLRAARRATPVRNQVGYHPAAPG